MIGNVMIETILCNMMQEYGATKTADVLLSYVIDFLDGLRSKYQWRTLFKNVDRYFVNDEAEEVLFYKELKSALSEENMNIIAKDSETVDGYILNDKLMHSFMDVMISHGIPYDISRSYSEILIDNIVEQLRVSDPQKYSQFFEKEWKEESDNRIDELNNRIVELQNIFERRERENISILSAGEIDIDLRKSVKNHLLGIISFEIDDDIFKEEFEEHKNDELIYIKSRCREETIYCVINELWRLHDERQIYIVKSLESWNMLRGINCTGTVFIPLFYADEIVAIENNTNIFVLNYETPKYTTEVIELRPRLYSTIANGLVKAGFDINEANELVADTHGLFIPLKKKLFNGSIMVKPSWMNGISDRAKKTCMLIGSWEEIDGDKSAIEDIYGDSYDKFLEEITPFMRGEDPLIYRTTSGDKLKYSLACIDNVWLNIDISINEPIWKAYTETLVQVLNEPEKLFTCDNQERILAELKGERLFWSSSLRKGMLTTLMVMAAECNESGVQNTLDCIVKRILGAVKNRNDWSYISLFWPELCEISPRVILDRLEKETRESTGILRLFENQSDDFIFGRNEYIDIIFGVEQFLLQYKYFSDAFDWLLYIDSMNYKYKSNSVREVIIKVLCTYVNFTCCQHSDEKVSIAERALQISPVNSWNYIFSSLDVSTDYIIGELSKPKRCGGYSRVCYVTNEEIIKTRQGYLKLLLENMKGSSERCTKMVKLSTTLSVVDREVVLNRILQEIQNMQDADVIKIKNEIRHQIYRHRFYESSSWAMSEEEIIKYEDLLEEIHTKEPEYEFTYLFINEPEAVLLHPVSFDEDDYNARNNALMQSVLKNEFERFINNRYEIRRLIKICSNEKECKLGSSLAKYWNHGNWDYDLFIDCLEIQPSGHIALSYLSEHANDSKVEFCNLLEDVISRKVSDDVIVMIYRIEAASTANIPLISDASENLKTLFWRKSIYCNECNDRWAIIESGKYSSVSTYIEQIIKASYKTTLSAEELYDYLDIIESMPPNIGETTTMDGYYIKELLKKIQLEYMYDDVRCLRISQIEIMFMNLLEWADMKCFQRIVKKYPEPLVQIIDVVFKHSNEDERPVLNQIYVQNMYSLYNKACFCPGEENGIINEPVLNEWLIRFKDLLISNKQENLYTRVLGRLFSFSPVGNDGYKPSEAIRHQIEELFDENMLYAYCDSIFNQRGVYSMTAGKDEHELAMKYKAIAEYHLCTNNKKTARIYDLLSDTYMNESKRERRTAENGWY